MSAATDSTSRIVWACARLLRSCCCACPRSCSPPAATRVSTRTSAQRVHRQAACRTVDAWDQKPPGIFFVYAAAASACGRRESVVALADLTVAALVALAPDAAGPPRFGGTTAGGLGARALFLLFAHPALTRLERRLRAQPVRDVHRAGRDDRARAARSSPRAPAVHARRWPACVSASRSGSSTTRLPTRCRLRRWPWPWSAGDRSDRGPWDIDVDPDRHRRRRSSPRSRCSTSAAHGALTDLRLATIDYNLRYSGETYAGPIRALLYPLTLPILRARIDMLWFLGGVGALLALTRRSGRPLGGGRARLDWRGVALDRHQRRARPAAVLRAGGTGARLGRRSGIRRTADAFRRHAAPRDRRRRCSASGASASSARVRRLQVRRPAAAHREHPLRSRLRPRQDRANGVPGAVFRRQKFDAVATDETDSLRGGDDPAVGRCVRVWLLGRQHRRVEPPAQRVAILLEPPGDAGIRGRTSGLRRRRASSTICSAIRRRSWFCRSTIGISAKRCRTRRSSS